MPSTKTTQALILNICSQPWGLTAVLTGAAIDILDVVWLTATVGMRNGALTDGMCGS